MVKQQVAEREVEKINSGSENKVIVKENEEEAYQTIADEFGVEPVRMRKYPEEMEFKELELNSDMQNAWMNYEYKGEIIRYGISTMHQDMSLGLGLEDEMVAQYKMQNGKIEIQINEYKTPKTESTFYSASYAYYGLEYCMIGKMKQSEFENIIKNLFFY